MLMLGMVVVSSVTENVGIGECFNLTSLVCSLVDRYIGDYGYWLRREHSPDRNDDDDDDDGGPSGKEKSASLGWLAGWLCSLPVPVALSVGLGLVKDYDLCPLFRLLLHRVSCVRLELRQILRVGKGQGQWTGIPAPGWTVDWTPSSLLRRHAGTVFPQLYSAENDS